MPDVTELADKQQAPSVPSTMLEFLKWVAVRARTYAEAMDAWRTSCPRLSVWEDATIGGFVRLEQDEASGESIVTLTPVGRSIVADA